MARDFKIEMPSQQMSAFLEIVNLGRAALLDLAEALEQAEPSLQKNKLLGQLRSRATLQSVRNLDEITQVLITLAGTVEGSEADANETVDAVFDLIEQDDVVNLELEDISFIKSAIVRMVLSPALLLIRSALDIRRYENHSMTEISITTNMSPLFLDRATPNARSSRNLRGALIAHEMRLTYNSADKEDKISLTLDSEDLGIILRAVTKALSEDNELRSFLQRSKLAIINQASAEE